MKCPEWVQEFPGAVTVCDTAGTIIYMNDCAVKLFRQDGRDHLIGSNVLNCHPGRARAAVESLLRTGGTAVFTVEKNDATRVVYDAPWYVDGVYSGLVEISFYLTRRMKNFVRDGDLTAGESRR